MAPIFPLANISQDRIARWRVTDCDKFPNKNPYSLAKLLLWNDWVFCQAPVMFIVVQPNPFIPF